VYLTRLVYPTEIPARPEGEPAPAQPMPPVPKGAAPFDNC